METKTFARLLLTGAVLLTVLLAIPLATAWGAAEPAPPAAVAEPVVHARFDLGGDRSYIGVSVRDVSSAEMETGMTEGAVVDDVQDESPAAAAGVARGDVFVEFDGERVRSARQLTRLVQETPAGRTVAARVRRGDARVALRVTPAAGGPWMGFVPPGEIERLGREVRSAVERLPELVAPGDIELRVWPRRARLGIEADAVGGQLADYFGVEAGVLVTHVVAESVAAEAGVHAGDVITAIDGQTIADVAALRRRVSDLEPGATFDMTVTRDGTVRTLTARLAPNDDAAEPPRRWHRRQTI